MTQAPPASKQPERSNILIVDDVPEIGQLLAEELRTNFHRILIATNGGQALKLLEDNPVHLVITDIFMPDMDGFELAEHIWQSRPELPILFISGYVHREFKQTPRRKCDFLYKPFSRITIIEKIARLLEDP